MSFSFFAREDSNSANNPALNLKKSPATELTFAPSGGSGDAVLETNGGGVDPDTLVEIGGVSYDFVFEFSGVMPTAKSDGAQQVPDQFEGSAVLLVTVQDYPTTGETTRFAFLPDANATEAEMNAFGNGAIDVQNVDTTPTSTPVCFVKGTRIATPTGDRAVEDLRAGDMVLNASGAAVEIRWISFSHFSFAELLTNRSLRPIEIPCGFLGRGRPNRTLWVSPQHRIVLGGWRAELHLGYREVFVPARQLVGDTPFCAARWAGGLDYYHLLFDQHEILVSNGLESESFFPGDQALSSLGDTERAELTALGQMDGFNCLDIRQTALPTVDAFEAPLIFQQDAGLKLAA